MVNYTSSTDLESTAKRELNEKRQMTAAELVETEESYVDYLRQLHDTFYRRLQVHIQKGKEILDTEEINTVFMNLPGILGLSKGLLKELMELRYKGPEALADGISDVIKKFVPFFKLYIDYVAQYPTSRKMLEKLEKHKKWTEFLEFNQAVVDNKLDNLLIMPIQRVPRYVLLLDELHNESLAGSRCTLKRHLDTTSKELHQVADFINNSVKTLEARTEVVTLQQDLFNNKYQIVSPTRYYVMKGDLKKVHNKYANFIRRTEEYYFILFNDILIYVSKSGILGENKYAKFQHALPLSKLRAETCDHTTEKMVKEGEVAFKLISSDPAAKSFVVIAPNEEERDTWIANISKHSDTVTRQMNSLFRVPDTVEEIERIIMKADEKEALPTHQRTISKSENELKISGGRRPSMSASQSASNSQGTPPAAGAPPPLTSSQSLSQSNNNAVNDSRIFSAIRKNSVNYASAPVNAAPGAGPQSPSASSSSSDRLTPMHASTNHNRTQSSQRDRSVSQGNPRPPSRDRSASPLRRSSSVQLSPGQPQGHQAKPQRTKRTKSVAAPPTPSKARSNTAPRVSHATVVMPVDHGVRGPIGVGAGANAGKKPRRAVPAPGSPGAGPGPTPGRAPGLVPGQAQAPTPSPPNGRRPRKSPAVSPRAQRKRSPNATSPKQPQPSPVNRPGKTNPMPRKKSVARAQRQQPQTSARQRAQSEQPKRPASTLSPRAHGPPRALTEDPSPHTTKVRQHSSSVHSPSPRNNNMPMSPQRGLPQPPRPHAQGHPQTPRAAPGQPAARHAQGHPQTPRHAQGLPQQPRSAQGHQQHTPRHAQGHPQQPPRPARGLPQQPPRPARGLPQHPPRPAPGQGHRVNASHGSIPQMSAAAQKSRQQQQQNSRRKMSYSVPSSPQQQQQNARKSVAPSNPYPSY